MARRHGPFDVVLIPVDGAVVSFPHRQPASTLPAALDRDQAASAGSIPGARLAVPIHPGGCEVDGIVPAAAQSFAAAAAERGVPVRILDVGETTEISAATGHEIPDRP